MLGESTGDFCSGLETGGRFSILSKLMAYVHLTCSYSPRYLKPCFLSLSLKPLGLGIMLVWQLTLYLKVEPLAHSFFNLHHYTAAAKSHYQTIVQFSFPYVYLRLRRQRPYRHITRYKQKEINCFFYILPKNPRCFCTKQRGFEYKRKQML